MLLIRLKEMENSQHCISKLGLIVIIMMFALSCNKAKDNGAQSFSLQFTNDSLVSDFSKYRLIRTNSLNGNLTYTCEKFIKDQKESEKCVLYKNLVNSIFEVKIISDFDNKPLDTVMILCYSDIKRDTSYHYFFDVQKFPPTKPFGSDDYYYSLVVINDNLTAYYKENYSDSTYSELHFFNKEFAIVKIIEVFNHKYYEFNTDRFDNKSILKKCFYTDYFFKVKTINDTYKRKTSASHLLN